MRSSGFVFSWKAGRCFSPHGAVISQLRERVRKTVMVPEENRSDPDALDWRDVPLEWREKGVIDRLFTVTYEELRRLASSIRRSDPNATLSPTTLVHEAWVKLAQSPPFAAASRIHFKRIAARAMRQVLIEAARQRKAEKRGGGAQATVLFGDEAEEVPASGTSLLALDAALNDLARVDPRQAAMVEGRFFGGLDVAEMAALLGVSEATVLRDWRAAKAWLAAELR
jgi:RNA polymerase sigma factor (TIGR02999 family)